MKKIVKTIEMDTKQIALELMKIARAATKLAESLEAPIENTVNERDSLVAEKKCLLCKRVFEETDREIRGLHAYCRTVVGSSYSDTEAIAKNLLLSASTGGRPPGVVQKAIQNAKSFTDKARQPKTKRKNNNGT